MRFRLLIQTCAAGAALVLAAPALAQDGPAPGTAPEGPDTRPQWQEGRGYPPQTIDPGTREAWLRECRRRISVRDDGLGGAVIGGVVGGVVGNRIAGRGSRTVGTIAGAAVGAAAGAAIDKAEDNGRVRDDCEAYLDSYYDYYAHAGRGYGYGYGAPMMVPAPRSEPECTETVEEIYEDVPVRPKARRIPSKRVKVVPDKRIRTN